VRQTPSWQTLWSTFSFADNGDLIQFHNLPDYSLAFNDSCKHLIKFGNLKDWFPVFMITCYLCVRLKKYQRRYLIVCWSSIQKIAKTSTRP
jgi:hypothetical protein